MKHNSKKFLIFFSIFGIFFFVSYLIFSPNSNQKSKSNSDSNNYSTNYNSAEEAIRDDLKDESVFNSDSGFLDFSQSAENLDKNDLTEKSKYYDPANITEEERERRRKLTIERMKPLAELFPNNRYIPREYSKEELEKINKKEEIVGSIQERILSGDDLTPDEKLFYFSEKKSDTLSKLEIFNYAKDKMFELGKGNNPNSKIFEERLQSIESRSKMYDEEINTAKKSGGSLETRQIP